MNDFSGEFMKYRAPSTSSYPSYTADSFPEQPPPTSSWLNGEDFNFTSPLAGDLFTSATTGQKKPPQRHQIDEYQNMINGEISYGNLSGINMNLDQIKIVKW